MSEFRTPNPDQLTIPDRFDMLPFCESGALVTNNLDVLTNFRPKLAAEDPYFLEHLANAYNADKAESQSEEQHTESSVETLEPSGPGLDLRNPDHLDGMFSHTVTHAVAGLLDAGVSDTRCIPYWDRDAVIAGARFQDPETAQERVELMDVLSMNVLRAYCYFAVSEADDHTTRANLLDAAIQKGKRSMRDMSPAQHERRALNRREAAMYTDLFVAKFKHLSWLVDAQSNPAIRLAMRGEISDLVDLAVHEMGIPVEDLTIDMGADAGISSRSDRPAYDISMFRQLAHLHDPNQTEQIIVLPQHDCDRLSITDILSSIDREGTTLPYYEMGMKYRLPWRFEEV